MVGHRFLKDTFGVTPRVGWQIDPFGHSVTNARLFAEMGFDALFFGRIDHQDKDKRMKEQSLEFIWNPSENSSIFTHVLFNLYHSPPAFDKDILAAGLDIGEVESDREFDVKARADDLIKFVGNYSQYYRTDEAFILFGNDFRYKGEHATSNFEKLDSLIEYINTNFGDQYYLKYSSPSIYIDKISQLSIEWPTK